MDTRKIEELVHDGCRHLLGAQHRDPYAPTCGCFDRRYWGWKLADFPDATLQRGVLPLSWLLARFEPDDPAGVTVAQAVRAGLLFAARIQHRDGSFDQAFPHEHSFGATAFLLHPLLAAYRAVRGRASDAEACTIDAMLRRAADFLCTGGETHATISNHLAGAALALVSCGTFLSEARYHQRAAALLGQVLDSQSDEGWFPEYDGADPGYQTLCVHYLAQIHKAAPDARLRTALDRAVEFLAWFAHPDGTFGGEYGSRRTAICYPGGFALLAGEIPLARSLVRFAASATCDGRTVTPFDVDMGNLSPLLESWVTALAVDWPDGARESLPCERASVARDFQAAGLFVRGTSRYYAIVGSRNGGVLKVFDKTTGHIAWDDGGYVGQLANGCLVTSQAPCDDARAEQGDCQLVVSTRFVRMDHRTPTPIAIGLLRAWGILGMWNTALREWTKGRLVRLLITGRRAVPLRLTRTIEFGPATVRVDDRLTADGRIHAKWLRCGVPFTSIHMASAGYFQGFAAGGGREWPADVQALNATGEWRASVTIPE
jgi:hypothetical protein